MIILIDILVDQNNCKIKIMIEYLQEGVGDSLRVTRLIDGLSLDGETPLMV